LGLLSKKTLCHKSEDLKRQGRELSHCRCGQKRTHLSLAADGKTMFLATQFMFGLYEYSVKKIDRELAKLFKQYYDEAYQEEMGRSNVPGFKVIPLQQNDRRHRKLDARYRI
jgi:hypothetical protein